ncbi:hypothetical protein V2G26_020867 [Clonostachys chloroleuca]
MLAAVLVLSRGLRERAGQDCGKSEDRKSVGVLDEVKSDLVGDDEGSVVAPKEEEVTVEKEEVVAQKEDVVAQKEELVAQKEEEVVKSEEEVVAQKEEEVGEKEKRVPVVVPEGAQEKCLQCSVRKLRCTLTKKLVAPTGDGVWREGPCWRCVQHGDGHECLVKPGPAGWEFAEKDFTALPYDPPADFYVRVTKERGIELVNFKEEARQREILEKWIERDEKVVVDTIASCTVKVKISAFAPPRPRNPKELEPFPCEKGAAVILRRSV